MSEEQTPENTEVTEAQPEETTSPKRNVTAYVLVALLMVVAGLGGYIVGDKHGRSSMEAAVAADPSAAAATAMAKAAADAKPGTGESRAVEPYNAMIVGNIDKIEEVTDVHRRDPNDPYAIGAIDAPVVISEFSDLECPFCSRFANQTEPTIMKDFVDKGLVRMEWNDFAVNGPNAVAAAKAGRAAAEQGKFIEFKKALYTASKDVNGHPNFEMSDFEKFAKEAGVPDMDKWRKDATSDKYDAVIDDARMYASQLGVQGTPGFLVGDEYIGGAQPTEVFIEAINQQLAKSAAAHQ